MKMKKSYCKAYNRVEPLCVFCFSPPFFIRGLSAEKRQSAPSRRQDFPFSTCSFAGLEISRNSREKPHANLLRTVSDLFGDFKKRKSLNLEDILDTIQDVWQAEESSLHNLQNNMERPSKKNSVQEIYQCSPQRRRLSVPETIMRKHNLAQECTTLQESKYFHWSNETQCSSDPNLTKKRDFNIIRRSTLLRRLWADNSKPKLSGSFQEWKHSSKKMSSTQSLNSSPEHSPRNLRATTPTRKKTGSCSNKVSAKSEDPSCSSKRKNLLTENYPTEPPSTTVVSRGSTSKYTYSSFSNFSETPSSGSAYRNSISLSTKPLSSAYKQDENRNRSESGLSKLSVQESAVQTKDVTNLNVISNISLSQSTLDIIFKEVMKDVNKLTPAGINISSTRISCDNETPSNVPINSNQSNTDQLILGNVRTGSPYSKSKENIQPLVTRFSAVPTTASMEVNTSEENKEESDTASFVDSLEDCFNSPRPPDQSRKSSSDISLLLPEGKKGSSSKKSSNFFIPIEVVKKAEMKSVSELLPIKVRERLVERQQKREERVRQMKSALKSTKGVSEIKRDLQNYLPKRHTKPVLPSIESLKKSSKERNVHSLNRNSACSKSRSSTWTNRKTTVDQSKETYVLKENEHCALPRKVYQKTTYENANKRIEILEILECAEVESGGINQKSKNPRLVNSKARYTEKSVFLDSDNNVRDHKLDQLIANILIDSLNHDNSDQQNANLLVSTTSEHNAPCIHKFDAIPEEFPRTSRQSENNNSHHDISTRTVKKTIPHDSSAPKGWASVYTVHKESESTSDEGKKYLDSNKAMTQQKANSGTDVEANFRQTTKENLSDESKPDDYSSSSENESSVIGSKLLRRSFHKFANHQRRAKIKSERVSGDWSVTVSGSNRYGQIAPDVEMRLRFPKKTMPEHENYSENERQKKRYSDEKRFNFPKLERNGGSQLQKNTQKHKNEANLPQIHAVQPRKKIEGPVVAMSPSVIIPKQTKTSRNRYQLTRPRERFSLPDVPSVLDERQCYEILRRIPGILAVTGRPLNSQGKPLEER